MKVFRVLFHYLTPKEFLNHWGGHLQEELVMDASFQKGSMLFISILNMVIQEMITEKWMLVDLIK